MSTSFMSYIVHQMLVALVIIISVIMSSVCKNSRITYKIHFTIFVVVINSVQF